MKKYSLNNIYVFISLLVLIISSIIGLVSFSVNAKSDIDMNTNDIVELKAGCENTHDLIKSNQNRLTIIETHYEHITTQLNRIEKKLEG